MAFYPCSILTFGILVYSSRHCVLDWKLPTSIISRFSSSKCIMPNINELIEVGLLKKAEIKNRVPDCKDIAHA